MGKKKEVSIKIEISIQRIAPKTIIASTMDIKDREEIVELLNKKMKRIIGLS